MKKIQNTNYFDDAASEYVSCEYVSAVGHAGPEQVQAVLWYDRTKGAPGANSLSVNIIIVNSDNDPAGDADRCFVLNRKSIAGFFRGAPAAKAFGRYLHAVKAVAYDLFRKVDRTIPRGPADRVGDL